MEGWVDLGYPAMHRPGVEPVISRSQVQRPNHYTNRTRNRVTIRDTVRVRVRVRLRISVRVRLSVRLIRTFGLTDPRTSGPSDYGPIIVQKRRPDDSGTWHLRWRPCQELSTSRVSSCRTLGTTTAGFPSQPGLALSLSSQSSDVQSQRRNRPPVH